MSNKSSNSKHYKYKTRRFLFDLEFSSNARNWTITRRKTKDNKDVDDTKVIGEVSYSELDEYFTTQQVLNFVEDLSSEEYAEILNLTNEIEWSNYAYFISVSSVMNPSGNLNHALNLLEYEIDDIDGKPTVKKKLVQMLPIGMCIGVSLGLCFGVATGNNMALGLAVGVVFGILYGVVVDTNSKKKHEEISWKRSLRDKK